MLKFYWELLKDTPSVFRGTAEGWLFWGATVVVPLLAYFNPEIDTILKSGTFPRWYFILPLGLSLLCAIMRANYRRFQLQEADLRSALAEVAQLQTDLGATGASKPRVTLRAGQYHLSVTNDGGPATFRARLKVLECHNWTVAEGPWQALWQRTQSDEVEIFRHEHDLILLGAFSPTEGQAPGGRLTLWYFNLSRHEPATLNTTYLLDEAQPRPWLRLQVSIFSNPEPETPIVREVELRPEGITLLP